MSFWDNIRIADYSFEKLLLKAIGSIFVCICIFYLIDKGLDRAPELKSFYKSNLAGLRTFLFIGIAIFFLNYFLYMGSLGPNEEETKSSTKIARVSVLLWSVFWIGWGLFCGFLFSQNVQHSNLIRGSVIAFALVPTLVVLIFTERLRREILRQEAEDVKDASGVDEEPYVLVTERRLFAGYYSVLCILAFGLSLVLQLIFDVSS